MPLPRIAARVQKRLFNPLARLWAPLVPGYGVIVHTGRRSGRTYRTPLNVFSVPGGFAVVIAYGRESDWLRNLRAAGQAEVVKRRRRYTVNNPRLVSYAEARPTLPFYAKVISRGTNSPDVLLMDALPAD
jgi:deazaflavin-dependent oxidoreductase (nitroreductase family)